MLFRSGHFDSFDMMISCSGCGGAIGWVGGVVYAGISPGKHCGDGLLIDPIDCSYLFDRFLVLLGLRQCEPRPWRNTTGYETWLGVVARTEQRCRCGVLSRVRTISRLLGGDVVAIGCRIGHPTLCTELRLRAAGISQGATHGG